MPQAGWRRKTCRECGRPREEVEWISKRGYCNNCAAIRQIESMQHSVEAGRLAKVEALQASNSESVKPQYPHPPGEKGLSSNADGLDSDASGTGKPADKEGR